MNETKKQEYTEAIVSGNIPNQETYTKEEVLHLAKNILAWAALQIDHTWYEMKHDDVPDLVKSCEYKTPVEAITDVEQDFEEKMFNLRDFINDWLN